MPEFVKALTALALPEAAYRKALTTKDIGNLAAETAVLEGEEDVEEREDEELNYETDTKGGDSTDEMFDGSFTGVSEVNRAANFLIGHCSRFGRTVRVSNRIL